MNMVSLLIIGLVLPYDAFMVDHLKAQGVKEAILKPHDTLFWCALIVGAIGLLWAVWQSKRESLDLRD
jgi:hypothetical protein